jgi:hypothetical protein
MQDEKQLTCQARQTPQKTRRPLIYKGLTVFRLPPAPGKALTRAADISAIADFSAAMPDTLDADQLKAGPSPHNELIESLQRQDEIEAKHYGLQPMLYLSYRQRP